MSVRPYCSRVLEIRPARDDAELELALELNNTIRPDLAITMDNLRSYIASTPQEHFVAWEDGRALGSGYAALHAGRAEAFVHVLVRPEERRRGVGSALFDAVTSWAADKGRTHVESFVDDSEPDALAFLERRGFVRVGREIKVALHLADHIPLRVDPPDGIEIVTWAERPELAHGLYEVACEANPDIPGEEDDVIEPYEEWLAHHMQGSGDDPEATFVAVAGDEVVGFSKFSLTAAQPTVAFHDLTGVKRAWRGRGVAGALKRAQIAWAKQAGYERLVTNNEERNVPIRKLNEKLGYKPFLGRTLMRGPVSGAT
jgi:GNAT superfamily N-acetyltransferase